MLPCAALLNIANSDRRYIEDAGYELRRRGAIANHNDLFGGEFSEMLVFAYPQTYQAEAIRVLHVLAVCAVFEIVCAVIGRVAVQMINLLAFRLRAEECRGYDVMHLALDVIAFVSQVHRHSAILPARWFQESSRLSGLSRLDASHFAVVGNLVPTLAPDNRTPLVFHAEIVSCPCWH